MTQVKDPGMEFVYILSGESDNEAQIIKIIIQEELQ